MHTAAFASFWTTFYLLSTTNCNGSTHQHRKQKTPPRCASLVCLALSYSTGTSKYPSFENLGVGNRLKVVDSFFASYMYFHTAPTKTLSARRRYGRLRKWRLLLLVKSLEGDMYSRQTQIQESKSLLQRVCNSGTKHLPSSVSRSQNGVVSRFKASSGFLLTAATTA